MKRRDAISTMAVLIGAAMVSTDIFFSSCKSDVKEGFFTEEDISLLDEIGETIIPSSASSPGAKAAKIGQFMKVYVTDCYNAADQQTFFEAVTHVKNLSERKYGNGFLKLTVPERRDVLTELEMEKTARTGNKSKADGPEGDAIQTGKEQDAKKTKLKDAPNRYFSMLKELTVLGYFTSEVGANKARRYIQTPGSYNGNIPYRKGDKAWAT
jgi:glucoside 3-dehydrogenase (cytochrome c) hitch-hiker subunit